MIAALLICASVSGCGDKKENVSAKTERRIQAQKRAVLAPLKKEMQRLEQTMEALNQQKEQIEN